MKKSFLLLSALAAMLFATTAHAQDEEVVELSRFYKVHCEVGLVVHKAPNEKSGRAGTLENGTKVELAGERVAGSGEVSAITVKVPPRTRGEETVTWVKLKSPVAGYVLMKTSGNGTNSEPFEYLVPYSRE